MPFVQITLSCLMDILKTPALLVGLVTLLGLMLRKAPLSDVVKGSVKAVLGFLVLQGGAALIVQSLA